MNDTAETPEQAAYWGYQHLSAWFTIVFLNVDMATSALFFAYRDYDIDEWN